MKDKEVKQGRRERKRKDGRKGEGRDWGKQGREECRGEEGRKLYVMKGLRSKEGRKAWQELSSTGQRKDGKNLGNKVEGRKE